MTDSLCILGSTGSVGTQALECARHLGIPVFGLSANRNAALLEQQAREYHVELLAVAEESAAKDLRLRMRDTNTRILSGPCAAETLAAETRAGTVLNAILGIAGLRPTLAAIGAGKTLALANKESLVAAGNLVMRKAKENNVAILPVDSEHCALHQCLSGKGLDQEREVTRLLLTGSGGPFFGKTKEELEHVSLEDALRHPNWSMGKALTIYSSNLVNKGLELIEAMMLFGVPEERIEVLIHRESIVHSLVEFQDGAVLAQLAMPDMRLCIQYALTYPNKQKSLVAPLDLAAVGKLSFFKPDEETFPSIRIARAAIRKGGAAPCVYNAANEACVELFCRGKIKYTDMFERIAHAVDMYPGHAQELNVEEILTVDREVRASIDKSIS